MGRKEFNQYTDCCRAGNYYVHPDLKLQILLCSAPCHEGEQSNRKASHINAALDGGSGSIPRATHPRRPLGGSKSAGGTGEK